MAVTSMQSSENAILYDMNRRRYYSLDALAELVWRLVKRPMTMKEIADAAVSRFGVESEVVERALPEILSTMAQEGLIQVEDE